MRGKQAKAARHMVADALPSGAAEGITGRISRGRIMRSLTKYQDKDNGKASIAGTLVSLLPSRILEPDSVRQVYQHVTKPWIKTRAKHVS